MTKFEKGEEEFDGFLKELLLKLMNDNARKFHEDLEEDDVQQEFVEVMRIIYTHQQNENILTSAREYIHIIDQWVYILNHVPDINEKTYPTWFRLMKRAAAAPNAQTGAGRVNSDKNLAKTKLNCSMKDEIILTRIRVKCNGPPLSMFNPKQVQQLWLKYGHQYAKKISDRAVVIERIRFNDRKSYKSKIFL